MGLALQELWAGGAVNDFLRHFLPLAGASNGLNLEAHRRPRLPPRRRRHLLQLRSHLAHRHLHHHHAHEQFGINAGLWMSRLSICYLPGKKRLSTTQACATGITGTDPYIDLKSASNGAEHNHVVGAPAEEDVVGLGLQEYDVMALRAHGAR